MLITLRAKKVNIKQLSLYLTAIHTFRNLMTTYVYENGGFVGERTHTHEQRSVLFITHAASPLSRACKPPATWLQ